MTTTGAASNKSTARVTAIPANEAVAELKGLIESQIRAVSDLKPLIESSNAAVLDTRVAAAEARASVAEARASVAELRTSIAQVSSELVEQRDILNTIIDAIADLRSDYIEDHSHTSVDGDDDEE